MRTRAWLLWALLIPAGAGCNSSPSYLSLVQELLQTKKEVADVLANVKDPASMPEAKISMRKLSWRLDALSKKFKALPPPSPEEEEEVRKLEPQLQEAMTRMIQEAQRIGKLPGGQDFLESFKKFR